jgi:hypothetical protein
MQEVYEFVLKTEKLPSYNRISYIVFVLHALCFFFIAIIADNKPFQRYALTGSIICVVWTVLNLLRYYSSNYQRLRFTPGYLFVCFVWIMIQQYWVAAVVILLALLDYFSRRELIVRFTKEQVEYPSFPPRTIGWPQLQHVIIKDGLLTIDFMNNKMVQAEVDEETLSEEEKTFNLFANQCILASRKQQNKDVG